MPGEIGGFFFKYLIGSLLDETVEYIFPEEKKKIKEMKDDEWYDWDEFQSIAGKIGNELGVLTMKAVGKRIISQSKDLFFEQGFDSISKLLESYPQMFNMNIRDVPEAQQVKLVSFEPNRVVYNYPKGQPQALIEGYFSGFFSIYNLIMEDIFFEDKGEYYVVTVQW